MIKTIISNLFRLKLDRNKGICREIPKKKMSFIYFTEKNKEEIEEFLTDRYDFDFTETGIIVWDEDCFSRIGIIRSFFFPYNVYILKDKESFFYITKSEFDKKYEVIRW